MAKKPTGFVATCQCGVTVGAMDYERTDRREAGKLLGQWLAHGCTIEPLFLGTWNADIGACRCEPSNVPGVRRRPQKYQETWRVVPGVRTSQLLAELCFAIPKTQLSSKLGHYTFWYRT